MANFDLFAMAALPGAVPASNALTCPDDIFGTGNYPIPSTPTSRSSDEIRSAASSTNTARSYEVT